MNKSELIAAVYEANAERFKSKRDAAIIVNSVFDIISEKVIAGETVTINDFGKYSTVQRKAKKGMNIRTKEAIEIPAATVPKFSPFKSFKDKVNNANK